MKSKNKQKLELLAPAGNFKSLVTAINAGADAVYFGIEGFNMRSRAKNFKISDFQKIKKICDDNKVKKYLALNIIIYDQELKKVENIIKKSKGYVDAIICSDFSVIMLCKRYKIPFHISTQMSISNSETALFFKKLGAERIVLARELNLEQIKKISKIIPIEIFIHGAMCLSISGRCLMSQFMYNYSANRGECIQPCRRPYTIKDSQGNEMKVDNNYILSAKDLCTLPFFEKIKKSGAISFKIEGRNKEPEYIDSVVRTYRKAIDNKLTQKDIEDSINELKKVYNKGFSDGFFIKSPTNDDFSDVENSKAEQSKVFIGRIKKFYPKINVGILQINSNEIRENDNILIIGEKTGLLRHKITSIEINKQKVAGAIKGQEVGIILPDCKKNDEVYKIIDIKKT